MAKSLTNLRAQTRTYLDEVSADDWTSAEVDREINDKYMAIYTAVVSVFEDYYTSKSTDSTVADTQEYTLPTDLWKIRRVEVNMKPSVSGSVAQRAVRIEMDDELNDLGNANSSVSVYSKPAYYIRGNTIGFIPVPTETGTNNITYWYIATVSELSAAGDEINIPFPDRYGGLISLGAAATLLRKGQQEEAVAAKYMADFEIGIMKMQQELEDRIADGSKQITDVIGEHTVFVDGITY